MTTGPTATTESFVDVSSGPHRHRAGEPPAQRARSASRRWPWRSDRSGSARRRDGPDWARRPSTRAGHRAGQRRRRRDRRAHTTCIPALVQSHFLLAMASIAFALVAVASRVGPLAAAGAPRTVGRAACGRWPGWSPCSRRAAIVTGTVVTGTGPHAGEEDVRRWGFDISTVARIHSMYVLLVTIAVALVFALQSATRTERVRQRHSARTLSAWMFIAVAAGRGRLRAVLHRRARKFSSAPTSPERPRLWVVTVWLVHGVLAAPSAAGPTCPVGVTTAPVDRVPCSISAPTWARNLGAGPHSPASWPHWGSCCWPSLGSLTAGGQAHAQEDEAAQSITGRVQNRPEDGERHRTRARRAHRGRGRERQRGRRVGHRRRRRVPDPDRRAGDRTSFASTPTPCPRVWRSRTARTQQTAEVGGNQNVTRAFFLGESARDVQSKWSLLPADARQRLEAGDDHRHHVDRPVADLRHHRPVELRPRRDGRRSGRSSPSSSTRITGCTSSPRHWRRSSPPACSGAAFENGPVAAAAPSIDQPHVDDDRVDRPRPGDALHRTCTSSAATSSAYAQYTLQRDPISIGPVDLPPRTLLIIVVARRWSSSPSRCSCSRRASARRSVPCPTTPTWRRRAGSTPTG